MANQNDHFIDEVTEDLRRDRLFQMMRRYGWIAGLLVVALVGGAAWREYDRARDTASAQAFGDAILAAQSAGEDAAARAAAIAAVAADNPRQAVLRDILAGNALVEAGDIAAAAQRYDTAATAAGGDVVIRDLAALKSVIAQGPDMDPAARDAAAVAGGADGQGALGVRHGVAGGCRQPPGIASLTKPHGRLPSRLLTRASISCTTPTGSRTCTGGG